jgi:predicted  nucleic acid-binding Zn-ribbon protein
MGNSPVPWREAGFGEVNTMGPTNVALVKLFQVDQKLSEAQARLDVVSRNVRVQERKVNEVTEKLGIAQVKLREAQSAAAQYDLEIKTRDAQIEKLRGQQQASKNNREYQTFLLEINTQKIDRGKAEEMALEKMEEVEQAQAQVAELTVALDAEKTRWAALKAEVGDKVAALEAEIASIRPEREAAASAVPARGHDVYDRLADRFEGEAMAAVIQPNPRYEEYICGGCNMSLVTDVYNKLHTRDDILICPSCKRILYIEDDLPAETQGGRVAAGAASHKARGAAAAKKAVKSSPKLTAEQALAKFLSIFPGGFNDGAYEQRVRAAVVEAHRRWSQEFGGGKAAALLEEGAIGELTRKSDIVISPLTMLNRFDKMAMRESLSDSASARAIFSSLLPLVDSDGAIGGAFDAWADTLRLLPQRGARVCTWPVATLLPTIVRPDRFFFARTDLVTDTAIRMQTDLKFDAAPKWAVYERILAMAGGLLQQLRSRGAKDFIDVYGYMLAVDEMTPESSEAGAGEPSGAKVSASST